MIDPDAKRKIYGGGGNFVIPASVFVPTLSVFVPCVSVAVSVWSLQGRHNEGDLHPV